MSNLLLRKPNQRFGPGVRLGCLMLGNISFKRKIGKNWEKYSITFYKRGKKSQKSKEKEGFCSYNWDSFKNSFWVVCKLKARTFKKFEKNEDSVKGLG